MPLLDILTNIALDIGQTSNASDKAARIFKVNQAAREIYRASDLEIGLKEEVFDFDVDDSQQVALPPYVGRVRGMRYYDGRQAISLDDMRNRYNFNFTGENELWYLQWRKKEIRPLYREIQNQSVLTLSIPIAETEAISITIIGKTDKSERIGETLVIAAGSLEVDTTNNYIEVESVVKNRITTYNVDIFDVESNQIGEILNSEYQSYCQVYQIADSDNFTSTNTTGIEIWFKYKFQPFKNDNDCFLGTDEYDDAIYWKFMEHQAKDVKNAAVYRAKCQEVLTQTFGNEQAGQRTKINFKPNPYLNLPYSYAGGPRRYQ